MNVLLPLAVVAIAGTATTASAENTLSFARLRPSSSSVHFDLVASDGIGVVEIYDYRGHAVGSLLGSHAVTAGGNSELGVPMKPMPFNDVMAVLSVDGEKVVEQVVVFHRQGR